MRDLISVIVMDENDSAFRERCLNSVKRQSYTETEAIVVTEEGCLAVMEACHKARGEYLFFCSVTSIIQENTLDELYRETYKAEGNVLACADIYTKDDGVDYQRYAGDISLYGKLFSKSRLSEIQLLTGELGLFWRYELLLKYMEGSIKMVCIPQAAVYETSLQSLEVESVCRENILERFYEKLETEGLTAKNSDIRKVAQFEREESETEQKDNCIRYSCSFYENQAGHNAYLLVKKEYPAPQVVCKVQQDAVYMPKETEEMNGAVLSEYVIRKFSQGNLGLKTIIKALTAWLRYKLRAGGAHE